jgi:hypothetical protein
VQFIGLRTKPRSRDIAEHWPISPSLRVPSAYEVGDAFERCDDGALLAFAFGVSRRYKTIVAGSTIVQVSVVMGGAAGRMAYTTRAAVF